jgi:tight adherence protein B
MDYLALAAAASVMGAIVASMLAVYQSTASPRASLDRRLGNILGEATGFEVVAADYQALRQKRPGVPVLGNFLQGRDWTEELQSRLERADVGLSASEFVALRVFLALVGGGMPLLILGPTIFGLFAMAGLGYAGYLLPSFYVSYAQARRIKLINAQLVEALSMLSNSLKAGFGLMQSLDLASRELQHPIATELRRTLHDINVGSQTDEALISFSKRAGSADLDIVVTAMLIQQSTGGNLAEILDNVAHTMRERIRIRGEITTLTTQQMLTGVIIGGLPIVIAVFVSMINPSYISPLFTTIAGNVMLGGAIMMEIFGVILIKRILEIEV